MAIIKPAKLVTIATASDEFRRTLDRSFALYNKYQTAVHNDPPGAIGEYQDFLVKSPLKVRLRLAVPRFVCLIL